MKQNYALSAIRYTLFLTGLVFISGCVVRSYPLEKDRVDQDLTGNRGFLAGEAPYEEVKERKATRTTHVVEIELHSPIKFEKAPARVKAVKEKETAEYSEDSTLWGNRGYITESEPAGILVPSSTLGVSVPATEKYTVQKNDTLQKISMKFYGTTKSWNKIFEANKDKLKAPNKIYPGQIIDIPVDSSSSAGSGQLMEPLENLK